MMIGQEFTGLCLSQGAASCVRGMMAIVLIQIPEACRYPSLICIDRCSADVGSQTFAEVFLLALDLLLEAGSNVGLPIWEGFSLGWTIIVKISCAICR